MHRKKERGRETDTYRETDREIDTYRGGKRDRHIHRERGLEVVEPRYYFYYFCFRWGLKKISLCKVQTHSDFVSPGIKKPK